MVNEEIGITPKSIRLILVILTIISICASAVIAYSVTNETVKHNLSDIEDLKIICKNTIEKVNENSLNIAVLNTIAEDVKEIKQDIKLINKGK